MWCAEGRTEFLTPSGSLLAIAQSPATLRCAARQYQDGTVPVALLCFPKLYADIEEAVLARASNHSSNGRFRGD
jgi:hypothetical protein